MDLFETATPRKRRGLSGHESTHQENDEWLTPPEMVQVLGPFDLDPCSPVKRPWDTARLHYTVLDNGLTREWKGRVWCNPPYSQIRPWTERMAAHGNGILLVFARTDTAWFQDYVFQADALLFLRGRLRFRYSSGRAAPNPAGAGSVLAAYGAANKIALWKNRKWGSLIEIR